MNRMAGLLPLISLFGIQINFRTNMKLIWNPNGRPQTPFLSEPQSSILNFSYINIFLLGTGQYSNLGIAQMLTFFILDSLWVGEKNFVFKKTLRRKPVSPAWSFQAYVNIWIRYDKAMLLQRKIIILSVKCSFPLNKTKIRTNLCLFRPIILC